MKRQSIAALLALLLAVPAAFAQGPGRRVTWTEFQKEAVRIRLAGRNVAVELRSGEVLRCTVKAVPDDGLLVEPGRKTRQWARTNGEHRIPKEMIAAVSSKDRVGRKGLLGAVVGLGIGAALAAASAQSATSGEPGYGPAAGLVAIPLCGVGGYYLGHSRDAAIPRYEIVGDSDSTRAVSSPW
jgi:hypothetical protein